MFEGNGVESGFARSPDGRYEFGLQGFVFNNPFPTSITFWLDNTCTIIDQYGRAILRAVSMEGVEVKFAPSGPEAQQGTERSLPFPARPEYATHKQSLAALEFEGIDWLAYVVRWRDKTGKTQVSGKTSLEKAEQFRERQIKNGIELIQILRAVTSSGWPQLTYDELKKLPELPPTPIEELQKIRDPQLRKDALRIRGEMDAIRERELAGLKS